MLFSLRHTLPYAMALAMIYAMMLMPFFHDAMLFSFSFFRAAMPLLFRHAMLPVFAALLTILFFMPSPHIYAMPCHDDDFDDIIIFRRRYYMIFFAMILCHDYYCFHAAAFFAMPPLFAAMPYDIFQAYFHAFYYFCRYYRHLRFRFFTFYYFHYIFSRR